MPVANTMEKERSDWWFKCKYIPDERKIGG